MIVNIVHIHVKKGEEEKFRAASVENAISSLKEPGFLRFDILQQGDNPQKFIFYEVYADSKVQGRHRDTAHYLKWREIVDAIMEETRYGVKYTNCFPEDANWK
jgi:quinol monooxygenase YgiN